MAKMSERINKTDRKASKLEVKVNQDFVNELLAQAKTKKGQAKKADVEKLVGDSRFKSMFEDAEFKRDRDAQEFKGTWRPTHDVESEESEGIDQSEQDSEISAPAK